MSALDDTLLSEAYDALEGLQEHHQATLAEMLEGEEGYRDEDAVEALSTLLDRIQARLEATKLNPSPERTLIHEYVDRHQAPPDPED